MSISEGQSHTAVCLCTHIWLSFNHVSNCGWSLASGYFNDRSEYQFCVTGAIGSCLMICLTNPLINSWYRRALSLSLCVTQPNQETNFNALHRYTYWSTIGVVSEGSPLSLIPTSLNRVPLSLGYPDHRVAPNDTIEIERLKSWDVYDQHRF